MIGVPHHARRRFSVPAVIAFLVLAILLVIVGMMEQQPNWLVGAVAPFTLAWACWQARGKQVTVKFSGQGIDVLPSGLHVPYDDLRRVWFDGRPKGGIWGPVFVVHRGGLLTIPELTSVTGERVRQFLIDRLPSQPLPAINERISDYFHQQTQRHGIEQMHVHVAREDSFKDDGNLGAWCSLAMFVTGIIWIIFAANSRQREGFVAGGVILICVSTVLFFVRRSGRGAQVLKKLRDSSLVLSPEGLALVQGDLQGELRWDQLRDIKFKDGSSPSRRKLNLQVPGAQIPILDIYDVPLREIHAEMMSYWQR